jgi:hypothetical protein
MFWHNYTSVVDSWDWFPSHPLSRHIMAAEFSTLHEHEYYSTVVICLLGTETQVDGSACPQQQAPPYRFQSLHSTAAAGGKKVEHASEGARDNTAG